MTATDTNDPAASESGRGPLTGTLVIDVSTLGPGPYASMMLADFGADVIEIRRPGVQEIDTSGLFSRGKRVLTVDLRSVGGAELIARLTDNADVFLESYRPGTMERRGLGPDVLMARNPRLVYTRLTGWGQSGPYAGSAGHDINYVSVGGPLGAVGTAGPVPALNLLGDFAGGSAPAVLGTVMALLARHSTGVGQVVDAAMVDGASYLMFAQLAQLTRGEWHGRGTSFLSGVAPYYTVYRCADGGWFSVGAIEARFYAELVSTLGLDVELVRSQHDRATWPRVRTLIGEVFAARPRDHWTRVFAGSDACAYPVLELSELAGDPHLAARRQVSVQGATVTVQPAPRLSRTPGHAGDPDRAAQTDPTALLAERGLSASEIDRFRESGALQF